MAKNLAAELVSFLNQHIQSVGQLEVLLLIHSEPSHLWTAESVAQALRSNASSARTWLDSFASAGLVEKGSETVVTYRYVFKDAHLNVLVSQLIQEYKIRPLKVIDAITNRPTNQMLSFMDAFRIKKENDDETS